MFYQLIIYLNLLGIFFFSWFIDQEIDVKISAPTEVQAGESFRVDMSIEKGDIQSFSRYIQDLPYGLTAERISTANADFSFEDQRMRLIWLKLPSENLINVSYNITIDKRLKGIFELKGEFAFVDENERHSMEVSLDHSIQIIPNPDIAEDLIVDIKDFEEMLKKSGEAIDDFNKLAVTRSEPIKSGNYKYIIELQVKKGELSKFAKIEEQIPVGFRAVEGDSQDGIFSFSRGVAKILWMNLPQQTEFSVNYILIPDPKYSIEDLKSSGTFSYITANTTETIAIEQKKSDLADNYSERSTEQIDSSFTETENKTIDTDIQIQNDVVAEKLVNDELKEVEKNPAKVEPIVESPDLKFVETVNKGDLLQPKSGIYYRVQLSAGHAEVDIEKYFSARNITDEVKMEYHDGWRKYSTGSFSIYKDARDYRVKVWETTPIQDAFVSAYSDGRRITVQEALMVSNHRWYR